MGPIVDPEWYAVLVAPGPNRLTVIVRVAALLGLSVSEARRRIDAGELILAEGRTKRLYDLQREFDELGATVVIR